MLKRFNLSVLLWLLGVAPAFAAVSANVRLNSVGFLPNNVKRASVIGPAGNFNVRRSADTSIAYTGTLSAAVANADTAENLRTADFSALTENGSFYLDVAAVGQSPTFEIGPNVYNDPFWATVMGFYSHRCGTAVSYTWKSQTFGHAACHTNDAYQDYIGGGHVIRNGTRGWHDAGDYGKYTVNGAFATGMLLQAWEWHSSVLSQWTFPLPESGGAIPDYLDEIKWNLDWLLKMQAANGTAYHKLTSLNFAGFVMPEADGSDTFFVPYSSSATADLCAVMSMAARIYQPYDAAYAAQCQAVATAGWNWLAANPGEVLANQAGFGTGAYSEAGTDGDHRAWAAAEYWQTTGNAAALADFEARMAADADLVSTFWDWGEHAYSKRGPKNHGIFTYLLSSRAGRNATRVTALSNDLVAEANGIVATRNAHGYGRPLGTVYHWGSNGSVARQVMLLDAADQLSPNAAYVDTSLDALGHLFGRNTYARSFVTGVGYAPAMSPHDRHSASDGIVNPVPGHLVGGAEANASDWADVQGDFRTNEIAVNWDAALVAALARFVTVPPPATPTPTPTPTACFSATALRRVNVGGTAQTTGGNTWSADQAYVGGGWGYTGGAVSTNGNAIAGTTDDVLYNSGRYGMSTYQFTVTNGAYKVEIHTAETYFNTAGARIFSMTLEGQPSITNLDIYASVGGSAALVLTRSVTVSDGILTLAFSASADTAEVRAIAIYPATACPSTPTFTPSPNWTQTSTPTRSPSFSPSPTRTPSASITPTPSVTPTPCGSVVHWRINAGGGAFTDSGGNAWSADSGYTGGTAATVANAIALTTDDALYQSERYGSPLSYALAVPNGNYQVRFLFAETFHTAAAQRVFSVTLEGAAAITNLDIFTAAGGADRALQLTRTVTVADGTLNIVATASVDQAKFSGIEVLQVLGTCASPTPTGTISLTATRSPTPSGTATRSPSATVSSSGTPSVTASFSSTRTPLSSSTFTATGSVTASVTATRTATPSASPSSSATSSLTPGNSPTSTPTPSASPSFSATRSITPGNSPTFTPTSSATPSRTGTPSASPSFSATRSITPGNSPTFTPTSSATPTRSATPSSTPTPSASPSFSATRSITPGNSPTFTPTLSATPSRTPLPSASPSFTATAAATPGPSATLTAASTATLAVGDQPRIRLCLPVPQPQSGPRFHFSVLIEGGRADSVQLKVFSTGYNCVAQGTATGSFGPGWNHPVSFDLPGLPNGTYFLHARAGVGDRWEKAGRSFKMVVLR